MNERWPKGFLAAEEANDLVVKLEADNARLRAVVAKVAMVFDGDCGHMCPWCEEWARDIEKVYRVPHAPDCPAFTPDGAVK